MVRWHATAIQYLSRHIFSLFVCAFFLYPLCENVLFQSRNVYAIVDTYSAGWLKFNPFIEIY